MAAVREPKGPQMKTIELKEGNSKRTHVTIRQISLRKKISRGLEKKNTFAREGIDRDYKYLLKTTEITTGSRVQNHTKWLVTQA